MIRIFDKEELNFNSLGLGSLDDSITAIVVEEINGRYELEMEYPISGRHYDKIKLRNFILCKPNMYDEPQPFRIYAITKPINGVVTISGEHISYDTMGVTILPTRNEDGTISSFGGTLEEVLTTINNSAVIKNKNYFTLERGVDKNNVEKEDGYKIQKPMNLRSLLGGVEGSLLDEFKGEWSFDKFKVILNNERGKDRGLTIRYGKNMTDLEQELTGSNTFTAIFPFYSKSYSVSKTINSFVYQTVYTRNNVTPLRHDWLSLTDPNYGTNTPLVPLIESSQILVDGITQTVTRLVAIEVKTEGDYYGRLFAFRKNTKDYNNLFDVYITQRTIIEDDENNTTTETIQQIKMVDGGIVTPKFGNIYVVKGVILPDNTISEDTSFLNRKIAWDNNLFVQYTSDGFYIEVFNATEDMPNPFPNEPYIVDGKTYVRPRRPSVVTESEEKYVYLDLKDFVPEEPETSEETGDSPEKVYPFESDEGTMYVSESLKNLGTQKVLTLDLTDELDKIPNMEPTRMTKEMLFDKAEQYLKDNDLTKIKESVKVSFIKLSDSAEYERFKPLEIVTLGDKIDVIYEDLGVKTTHRVISTEYNVLTNAYNEIELGDKIGTISDNVVTMGDPVSGLTNDAEFTNKAYVTEFVAENAKITNAYIQNAIIEYLQVSKINISGLLEASAATIDELVTTLLIAEDAKIANLLEAGSIKVRGHITALSGDIGGSKIQNGKLVVSTSISIQGTDDGAQVHFIVDEFGNVQANSLSITGGNIKIGNNFEVTNDGKMIAKEASIEGDINIKSGAIKIGGTQENPNFEVTNDGHIVAKSAQIGDSYINEEGRFILPAANITGELTIGNLPDTVAEISDIPTKLSELENNKGYTDEAGVTSIIDGVVTTDYINAKEISVDVANVKDLLNVHGKIDADLIEVDDIKVTNSIAIGGTSESPNFEVDTEGNLTGKGKIDFIMFSVEDGVVKAEQFIMGTSGADASVTINEDGKLTATNAKIIGDVETDHIKSKKVTIQDAINIELLTDTGTMLNQTVINTVTPKIEQPDGHELYLHIKVNKDLWYDQTLSVRFRYDRVPSGGITTTRTETKTFTLRADKNSYPTAGDYYIYGDSYNPSTKTYILFTGVYILPFEGSLKNFNISSRTPTSWSETKGVPGYTSAQIDTHFSPKTSGLDLGKSNRRWNNIYVNNPTFTNPPDIDSDRRLKKDIEYDISRYDKLFDGLQPTAYKLVNGESGRTHLGLIAQDLQELLESCDIDSKDFAGFIRKFKDPDILLKKKLEDLTEDDYVYGIRYTELQALQIRQIQLLKKEIKELKEKIN